MEYNGYLLLDKPSDWTSFDVVAKTRGILKKAAGHKVKIGHTGTLDPLATGLLILVVGTYTKKSDQFTKMPKTYLVSADLSKRTNSHDSEGEIIEEFSDACDESAIKSYLDAVKGTINQVPPQFSAIKIDGQRAYKAARSGKTVEIEPRPVQLNSFELFDFDWPNVQFRIDVSSGFYVRSLLRDLGEALGVGDMMTALRRESVGEYFVSDAVKVEDLNTENIHSFLKTLE